MTAPSVPRSTGLGIILDKENKVTYARKKGKDFGFQVGDTITSFDDSTDATCYQIYDAVLQQPGKSFSFTLKRGQGTKSLSVTPPTFNAVKDMRIYEHLLTMLACGEKVNLLVLVVDMRNTFPGISGDWYFAKRQAIESDLDSNLLEAFSTFTDFSLVERSALPEAFSELKLQMTGAISLETSKQIGRMVGASHLLLVEFARFQNGYNSFMDAYNQRLVDLESAKILAISFDKVDPNGHFLQ
jgi:hypothetical protein